MINKITSEEFESLLPWYINGTLDDTEISQVEEFLKEHPEYSYHVDLAREEEDQVIYSNECAGEPSAGALDRLLDDISRESGSKFADPSKADFLTSFLGSFYEMLKPALLPGACSIIILQAITLGYFVQNSPSPEVTYNTASKKEGLKKDAGSSVLVQFHPDASFEGITALLDKSGFQIISGPKANKIYKVQISKDKLSDEELQKVLGQLRQQSDIIKMVLPAG